MADDGPKRPNYKSKPTTSLIPPELASEFMELLAESPEITRALHELFKSAGTTIDVQMHALRINLSKREKLFQMS
jgi:hypothetical protein